VQLCFLIGVKTHATTPFHSIWYFSKLDVQCNWFCYGSFVSYMYDINAVPLRLIFVFSIHNPGYFVVDKDSTSERLVFNRTVTLRDSYGKSGK
jgi:hypothetical protein